MQALIADQAERLGLSHAPILSGAGHDAQEWSRICKTAMVFVPGEYDGISHNPREFSTVKQCADGVDVLLGAALVLAEEP
ncbi:MAG: M20/M25/M40 family metallo-hydrolase [Elusimicrobiota bacterium]